MKPDDVLAATAETFGVDVSDLVGRNRTQLITYARQAAMLIMRDYLPWLSCQDIARLFAKDHTTVLWSVKAARERGKHEQAYQQAVLEALDLAREPKARAA